MTAVDTLTVESRERAGKGAARAVRRSGRIPAVVYGARQDPALISLDPRDLMRELERTGFFARLFDLAIGGKKERALARDVQFDPVTDRPIHVDFLRVSDDTTLKVEVPVVFLNQGVSPGLKRGGVLNIVRHEIELICRADAIPAKLEGDLTGLDIGDSLHISMIPLPAGVKPTIARDFTVATIAAPSAVKAEAAEAAAAAAAALAAAAVPAEGEEGAEGEAPKEGEAADEKKDEKKKD